MNQQDLKHLLQEQVLDFVENLAIPIVTHRGCSYVQFAPLSKYFRIDQDPSRRKFSYYQGLMIRRWNRKYIRVDFIPWWLANLHGNHNLSEESRERITQTLSQFGISVPTP